MSDKPTKNIVWDTLSKIDVSEHIEQKNGFNYLSWSWAWAKLKEHYPNATYTKHTFNDLPFVEDSQGYAYVTVTVRVPGSGLLSDGPNWECEVTETMPVLNHSNKPIQHPDNFAVNKSLQRCLVKAIACLGLGINVYQGEDLPESDDNTKTKKTTSQYRTAPSGMQGNAPADKKICVDCNQPHQGQWARCRHCYYTSKS